MIWGSGFCAGVGFRVLSVELRVPGWGVWASGEGIWAQGSGRSVEGVVLIVVPWGIGYTRAVYHHDGRIASRQKWPEFTPNKVSVVERQTVGGHVFKAHRLLQHST